MTGRTSGPFGALGDATSRFYEKVEKQQGQQRDEQARQQQLDMQREELALRQKAAQDDRFDRLDNGLGAVFDNLGKDAKYLDPEEATAVGEFQGAWTEARTSYLLNGDKTKLDEFQKKYPGGMINVTKGGQSTPMSLVDLQRKIGTNRPIVDLKEKYTATVGATAVGLYTSALSDPTLGAEDRTAITATMEGISSGKVDPYTGASMLAARSVSLTPQRLADSLLKGMPTDAKGWVQLKGTVDGMRTRYKGDAAATAVLDQIEANYNPALAPPERQEYATQNGAKITAYGAAEDATLKTPVVQLDRNLIDNRGAGLELRRLEETLPLAIQATNALATKTIGTVDYDMAMMDFAKSIMPLTQLGEKVGVLANIAKQGAQGVAAIEGLRKDPALMQRLGLTDADLTSAITRGQRVESTERNTAVLSDASTASTLIDMGIAGQPGIEALVKEKVITPEQGADLSNMAGLVSRARATGLSAQADTFVNESKRQAILGEDIEEVTRSTSAATVATNEATTATAENTTTAAVARAPYITELTEMGINVEKVTLRSGYMAQAYSLTDIRARLAAGLPEAEANARYNSFMASVATDKNTVIIQGAQGPYLARLTQTQMQAAQKMADNGLVKANVDGTYVFDLTTATNLAGISQAEAAGATAQNVLREQTALAPLIGPAAVSRIQAQMASDKTTTAQQANFYRAANAIAPYVGTAALKEIFGKMATDKTTIAQQTNLLNVAQAVAPLVGEAAIGQIMGDIARGKATVAEQTNLLTQYQTLAPHIREATLSELHTQLAGNRASTQEKTNLLNSLVAAAPYMGDLGVQTVMTQLAQGKATMLEARNLATSLQAAAPYVGQAAVNQILTDIRGNKASFAEATQRLRTAELIIPNLPATIRSKVALELAQGNYDLLKTQLASKDMKWDSFKANAESVGALATVIPWSEMRTIPGFAAWANKNKVDKSMYERLGQWAKASAATEETSNGGSDQTRILLNQKVQANRAALDAATKNPQYQGWIKEVQALQIPKVALDAMLETGFASNALEAGKGKYGARFDELAGKIIAYNNTVLKPKQTAFDTAVTNFNNYNPTNPNVGSGTTGAGTTDPSTLAPPGVTPLAGKAAQLSSGVKPSTLGFSSTAIYNQKQPDGSIASMCTAFAREFTEDAQGLPKGSLRGTMFRGTGTETIVAFRNKGLFYADQMTKSQALAKVGLLKAGDVVTIHYPGNPSIDHLAISDGKGGLIQHSGKGFQGKTIEGDVNYMTNAQFINGAGKNVQLSFGRVPAPAGAQRPPQGPARQPVASGSTPANTTPKNDPKAAKFLPRAEQTKMHSLLNAAIQDNSPASRQAVARYTQELLNAGYPQAVITKMMQESAARLTAKP